MECPGDAELAGFVDGELSADARGSIEVHIDACRTCRQTVSEAARRAPNARNAASNDGLPNTREPQAGDLVGRYRLIAPIGTGATGVVFSAHDPELDRRVAVKLLRVDATRQERLAREARALAKISHPNVVPVYDVGAVGERAFVAMELVDGATLRAHLREREVPQRERMQLLAQAAAGLAAAHEAGVVHRDFKPDNVLVGRDGRVRVSDFGLALEELADEGDRARGTNEPDASLTRSGALLGTPAYMAPEQLRGERADVASDQFAFCVTAWEVLFGERPFAVEKREPFTRDDARALLAMIDGGQPTANIDDCKRLVGPELVAALQRGLAFDPARRHPDLAPLIAALGEQPRSRAWVAAAVVASVALISGGVVLAMTLGDDDPCARAEAGLDHVWNAKARARVASAEAVRSIDAWAGSWRAISGATCKAHHDGARSAALFDRQQACLANRRDELAAMLALVGDVDPSRVPQLAASLGDLDACKATTFSPAPPASPELDAARRELAAAKTLRKAGRYQDAITALEALRPRIDALPDRALESQLLWNLGIASIGADKLTAARDYFSLAAAEAETARDDALKAGAWIELLVLVGDEVVELDEAARLEPLVRAALDRAEAGPALRAAFASAIGRIELRKGKFKEAIAAFDEAIAQQRKRTPIDRYELSNAMNSLAGAHGALGDHAKMLALLDESQTLATAAVGAEHPDVAAIWSNRVQPLHFLGRADEAMASAKKSVEIYEKALGGKGIRLARAIENLAVLHAMSEHYAEAAALFDRSRAMTEQALGSQHADVGQAWLNVASANREAGKLDEAVAGYEKSIAIWEKALGAEHVDLARPLLGLAKIHLERNVPTSALPLVERAVAIRESTPGNPAHVAHALFVHGQTVFALGDKPRTCERISKSLATYMMATHALGTKYDEDVAEIRAWLAERKLTCSADRRRER